MLHDGATHGNRTPVCLAMGHSGICFWGVMEG